MTKSVKETQLDRQLRQKIKDEALDVLNQLIDDPEVHTLQEYANNVSIKRLGYNDHGPVHMRKVTLNAINMLHLLTEAGIKLNLESEQTGTFTDSMIAVIFAAFLHDIGMSISRDQHELYSAMLATPIIERITEKTFPGNTEKKVVIRSLALEGILGHMATRRIHSLEAGLILIADGCDMEKGRARIPMIINSESKVGDIHKYSANEIERVSIEKGERKPIKIHIEMNASVGFFQVEEVLFPKINHSPVKPFIELYAGVTGREVKCYL